MGFFRQCVATACFWQLLSCSMMCFGGDSVIAPPSSYPSFCRHDQLEDMVRDTNFRSAVCLIDTWIKESKNSADTAFLGVEKAKILYADQQKMESGEAFLAALAATPLPAQSAVSDEEQKAFDALFPSYEMAMQSEEETAKLLQEALSLLQSHPTFLSLEHYIAAALANRGQFIEFYDRFFHAFQARHDCFLSKKTLAVLHLRLFEASTSQDRREVHRQEAVRYLQEAFTLQPHDSSLLVKLAFILPPNEKIVVLKSVTADLLQLSSPLRRGDCFFLIQQAMDVGEVGVARQLIEKARSWYQYSRALNDLSDQLSALEKTKEPLER